MDGKFVHKDFSVDFDLFNRGDDIIVRFFDKSREHEANRIVDLVLVDPGYGYICLKFKGDDSALLSGFLDSDVFLSDESIAAAIAFVQNLSSLTRHCYTPYHIRKFKTTGYIEYNGEY
ncbi:hypothetical protein [Dyadobacter sp. CY347]|uniref:hypothetical protein n=1 Tax=Dyadobacter sp. CY347 TaxID=2909336 RepID=UPI001F340716|nr:hypothetical protein [Dyadobacter sp. CY347]MCF2488194.1 hypothetical protein [Dyadobacter sp. CY347]